MAFLYFNQILESKESILMLDMRYQYIFSHVLGIDLDDNNIIYMKYYNYIFKLIDMMNINFYVKSMMSFIILSIMWYERLIKCYLLHTDLSEFRELRKTCQATCIPLLTLNHWNFTKHTSWSSKPWLPKFPRWDSWA